MLKAKWWTHVSYGLMPKNAECSCRKAAKRMRRPALHAFEIHCGTKLTWIAPPNTSTDSYIRFLSKAQPYLIFTTQTERSCQSFSFILKTGCNDESDCLWKQLNWIKFPFYGDRLSGKTIPVINIADSVSEKINQGERSPLIRRQVVWRNYSEQMTEKQNIAKTCTKSPEKKTPSIYRNRCNFDQKRKGYRKADINRLKSYKSSNFLLCKIII